MYTTSQAAFLLGVCATTIRRWDRNGKLRCSRTLGGHRRIRNDEIQRILDGRKRRRSRRKTSNRVVNYARVSSHEQKKKGDLERQQDKLQKYCEQNKFRLVQSIHEVGSGLNTKRRGIMKLFKLVCKLKVDKVVISYKDRLTRFGFKYLETFFQSYGVQIIVLEER